MDGGYKFQKIKYFVKTILPIWMELMVTCHEFGGMAPP